MGNYGFSVIDGDMKYIDPSGTVIDVAESGGGAFCVTFTVDDSGDDPVYSADKTFEEVATAIEAGNYVYGVLNGDRLQLSFIDDLEIWLSLVYGHDNVLTTETIVMKADDTVPISYTYVTYDLSSLIIGD